MLDVSSLGQLNAGAAELKLQERSHAVSTGQVALGIAYVVFLLLWGYAEILENRRRKFSDKFDDEKATLPESVNASTINVALEEHYSYLNSDFVKVLTLNQRALVDHRAALRAAVEFGSIMLWYYLADRTTVFNQGIKSYSRDVLGFLFLILTVVAWVSSKQTVKAPLLLNRKQTEEWKGWMQVLFLLYHYYEAREVYNAIRVFIAGYVWMTGFGNFSYYYKTGNYSFSRFCQMMWRLNFLVAMTCVVLQNSYMLYYICPMHTLFTIMVYAVLGVGSKYNASRVGVLVKFLIALIVVFVFWDVKAAFYALWKPFTFMMGYSDPRRPTDDKLKEWYFRSSLDRYVWIHGMLCAYLHPWAEASLQRIDKLAKSTRVFIRAIIAAAACGVLLAWYNYIYILPKLEYNAVHPYTSWIPITAWIVLRNMTPSMRTVSLGLYGWLGCITLETYISQFHTWLSTGIPDGQPKMLLAFFPAEYPLLNFAGTTAVYVFVSYRLFILTGSLKDVVIPDKTGKEMVRNFVTFAVAASGLFCIGWVVVSLGGVKAPSVLHVHEGIQPHFDP